VRPVCAGDVPALRSLFQRSEVSTAYGVEHRDPYIRGVGERYTEKTLSTDLASFASLSSVFKKRASEYWVAEHVPSGAVAGMVAVECISPGVGELRRMAVDEAFRRRGLAMRLVLHALDFAQQAGLHTVTLTTQSFNKAAISLYKKAGFVEVVDSRAGSGSSIKPFTLVKLTIRLPLVAPDGVRAENSRATSLLAPVGGRGSEGKRALGADAPRGGAGSDPSGGSASGGGGDDDGSGDRASKRTRPSWEPADGSSQVDTAADTS